MARNGETAMASAAMRGSVAAAASNRRNGGVMWHGVALNGAGAKAAVAASAWHGEMASAA